MLSKVIQPGDLINIDAGIKAYDIWCTDVQRFAYVLREGETAPARCLRCLLLVMCTHPLCKKGAYASFSA